MAIKPGPQLITVGGVNLLADDIKVTYATETFDRVEFSHEKLKTAPLTTGVTPLIGTLLGNVPYEIVINCAIQGNLFVTVGSSYQPRPVTPDILTTDTDKIKQRINITRYTISGGQTPETTSLGTNVDSVLSTAKLHKDKLAQFQNRLAIFGGTVAYEQLVIAQSDNIYNLYFSTGMAFSGPGINISDCIITDFSESNEYIIPLSTPGTYDIRKGYNMTIEVRTVTAASAS